MKSSNKEKDYDVRDRGFLSSQILYIMKIKVDFIEHPIQEVISPHKCQKYTRKKDERKMQKSYQKHFSFTWRN